MKPIQAGQATPGVTYASRRGAPLTVVDPANPGQHAAALVTGMITLINEQGRTTNVTPDFVIYDTESKLVEPPASAESEAELSARLKAVEPHPDQLTLSGRTIAEEAALDELCAVGRHCAAPGEPTCPRCGEELHAMPVTSPETAAAAEAALAAPVEVVTLAEVVWNEPAPFTSGSFATRSALPPVEVSLASVAAIVAEVAETPTDPWRGGLTAAERVEVVRACSTMEELLSLRAAITTQMMLGTVQAAVLREVETGGRHEVALSTALAAAGKGGRLRELLTQDRTKGRTGLEALIARLLAECPPPRGAKPPADPSKELAPGSLLTVGEEAELRRQAEEATAQGEAYRAAEAAALTEDALADVAPPAVAGRTPLLTPRPFDVLRLHRDYDGDGAKAVLVVCCGYDAAARTVSVLSLYEGGGRRYEANVTISAWTEVMEGGDIVQVAAEGVEEATGKPLWAPPVGGYDYGLGVGTTNMKGWTRAPDEHYPLGHRAAERSPDAPTVEALASVVEVVGVMMDAIAETPPSVEAAPLPDDFIVIDDPHADEVEAAAAKSASVVAALAAAMPPPEAAPKVKRAPKPPVVPFAELPLRERIRHSSMAAAVELIDETTDGEVLDDVALNDGRRLVVAAAVSRRAVLDAPKVVRPSVIETMSVEHLRSLTAAADKWTPPAEHPSERLTAPADPSPMVAVGLDQTRLIADLQAGFDGLGRMFAAAKALGITLTVTVST